MKKYIFILLTLLLVFGVEVSAHPGGTDGEGGHYNRSTGEYHYHHGYPEHQHIDGMCPYNFKDGTVHDTTDSDSNHSNYSKHSDQGKVNRRYSTPNTKTNTNTNSYIYWRTGLLVLIIGIPIIIHFTKTKKEQALLKRKQKEEYENYYALYANKDPLTLVDIPQGVYLENGIPVTNGNGKYGAYTVYVTKKGKCFHQDPFCVHGAEPKHIICVYRTHQGCKRCFKHSFPKYKWFFEYNKIVEIKKKYNIP